MNSKSIKKFLPLSGDISMSKNHSVPNDNWDEVEDNNSPIHNDALCPLFYTETKTENPSITDKYGNIYTTVNGFLTKNGKNLFEVEDSIFTKQEIEADLSTFYNNEIYRAYHSGSSVIIEKSSDGITFEHYNTVVNSSFAINIIERLWHGHYVALTLYNGRTSIIFDNNIQYLSEDTNWLANTESPIMTLTEYEADHYLIYICNKSGAILQANSDADEPLVTRLLTFNTADGFTVVTNKTWTGNIDVPSTTEDIYLKANTALITKSDIGSETRICYKQNDKYYDLETENELTFSPGYAPIATSTENQYRYAVYTTKYHYDYDITSSLQDWGTATPAEATVHFNINLNSANQPVTPQSWSETLSIENWTGSNTLSFDITLKNNYGYITSTDLINFNPIVEVHHESAEDMTFTVPAEYTSVTGMGQYNRNVRGNSKWAKWSYSVSSSSVTATFWSGTHLYMPDDSEYIYPFYATGMGSTESSTFVGYNNKATYSVTSTNTINFTAVRMDMCGTSYGGYQMASSVSIGYGYFRHTFLTKTENTAFEDDVYTDGLFKTYDMLADIMLANTGAYRTSTAWNETNKVNAFYLPTGTKANVIDTFTPLFNNGFISGISYNSTLVTPWLSIDTSVPFYTDNNVAYYRDIDTGKWILIRKETKPVQLSLVENRYLVLNTTSYWNCYDTKLEKINKYAYDWNNRIFFGKTGEVAQGSSKNWIYGSGANVNYSVINKNSGISSAVFAAYVLADCTSVKYFPTDEKVDIEEYEVSYTTSTSVAPTYYKTFHNIVRGPENDQLKYNDSDLSYYKAAYPLYSGTSMMRNPSIFAKWSLSGNNQDYMIDGDNGFQVIYEDTEPMLLTATSGSIKGMESIFVIQSMPYAVLNGKIYSLSYLNGEYQGRDCIININGMKYIGAVPSKAYFYSPNNRAIYIFTGDANLTKAKDASAISDIYYITSNPATQTIYMATNDGLYMISDRHSFKQTFYNVQSITFIEDGTVSICHKQNDGYTNTRFYYEDEDGRKTNKVRYCSGLLGAGEHRIFAIDKYNISLFSDQKRNGALKVKSYVLLDNGQIQEEESSVKISKTDWDDIFYSKQIDFTPKYSKGVGVGIMIESDFAVSNITASCTVEPATNPASSTKWCI